MNRSRSASPRSTRYRQPASSGGSPARTSAPWQGRSTDTMLISLAARGSVDELCSNRKTKTRSSWSACQGRTHSNSDTAARTTGGGPISKPLSPAGAGCSNQQLGLPTLVFARSEKMTDQRRDLGLLDMGCSIPQDTRQSRCNPSCCVLAKRFEAQCHTYTLPFSRAAQVIASGIHVQLKGKIFVVGGEDQGAPTPCESASPGRRTSNGSKWSPLLPPQVRQCRLSFAYPLELCRSRGFVPIIVDRQPDDQSSKPVVAGSALLPCQTIDRLTQCPARNFPGAALSRLSDPALIVVVVILRRQDWPIDRRVHGLIHGLVFVASVSTSRLRRGTYCGGKNTT